MALREFAILDTAPLRRGQLAVLELDAPSPLIGLTTGTRVHLVFQDGSREAVELKSLGFASSTPDHAHVIVTMPIKDVTGAIRLELEDVL
ncbi:MAG: hypothetical protein RMJ98_04095 [Myxococcales bacterium]|nr:hypothetical protein [Polyangiaceae bacterium]MDW8248471.1 hypothetical protein [Myxococcales bacterium]